MQDQTFANPEVLEFYKELPFNYQDSAENQAKTIRSTNSVAMYPILTPLLGKGISVLEVGCGTGWLSNGMSFYYQASVTGIDFNPIAIERCQAVAKAMDLPTHFQVADLFLYQPKTRFDVVVSLGVLMVTNNCYAAVRRLCADFVRPGGHVMIGLYHTYGRKPFLDYFQGMKDQGMPEKEMIEKYRELHPLKDETHLLSWFRDQVIHPHETQHTLAEMLPILEETNMELISTSINRFEPIESIDEILKQEITYLDIAKERLKAKKYFPGFFVFLARKRGNP
jgi:2-polyprenyl-3-methyl-5-hydroxy-6-metoxy-1,4-benzoquinol methylase